MVSLLIDRDISDFDSLHRGLICSHRFMEQGVDDCTFIFSGTFTIKCLWYTNIDTGAQLWHLMFSIPFCQVTAPYLHIGGVVLMTLLSWPIALHVFRISICKDEFLVYLQYPKYTFLHHPDAFYVTESSYTVNSLPVSVSVRRMAIMVLYVTVLVTLYLVPLGMYSPCIKERSSLGSAPALIGHRGAPMVHFIILLRFFRFKHQPLNIFFPVLTYFLHF